MTSDRSRAYEWYVSCLVAFLLIAFAGTCAFREHYATQPDLRRLRDELHRCCADVEAQRQATRADREANRADLEAIRARLPAPPPQEFRRPRRQK